MDANVFTPLVVLGTLGTSLVLFTRTLTDYILKKKMIEKGFINEESQSIFKKQQFLDSRFSSLKWGLITFFAGLSLIIIEYVPHDHDSPLPYGLFTMFVSLGFLTYYFIIKNENKQ